MGECGPCLRTNPTLHVSASCEGFMTGPDRFLSASNQCLHLTWSLRAPQPTAQSRKTPTTVD